MQETQAREQVRVLSIVTRMALAGGASHVARFLADGLDRSRFEPYLAYGPTPPGIASLAPPPGVRSFELPELKKSMSPVDDLRALRRLRRLIREVRPEIVLTHSSKAGVLGRLAAHWEKVPVILHQVHGWSFHNGSSGIMQRGTVALERYLARRTDGLLFVSTTDIEKARRHGIGRESQYHVVRAGIDLTRFGPATAEARASARELLGIPQDRFVVGTVARIDNQKAPLDWADSAARIAQRLPEAVFVWVGDGPLRADLAAAFENAGIMDRVTLAGFRQDVEQLYAAFDVYLLVSLWEGLPRTLVEAMATGTPVVASHVDGNAEIVEHGQNGFLVPPRAPEQAAEAVLELATDQALRAAMSSQCVECSRQFSADRSVADLQELCEALLGGRGGK